MNIADIITEFGAYYEQAGQNKNRISGMLSQGLVTPQYMTEVKTDDTIYRLGKLAMGHLVQPFQKTWTPVDPVAMTPNEGRLFNMKVDLNIWPDDVKATWLGFLESESLDRKDWPLIKFLLEHPEQGILKAIQRDMEIKEYGHGVYEAPEGGTAGVTGTSMNGFIKQLQTGLDGGTINSINIGELDKDTILEQVEEFTDKIDQVYQGVGMNVFMSEKWAKLFLRAKRDAGYYMISGDSQIKQDIDFTVQKVVGLPSLVNTNHIFATPKSNFLHLTKNKANSSKIKLEEYHREVSMLTDWWEGIMFAIDAAVWTNITATGSGSGS